MNPQTWWYLARASGLVAWVLLVASLVWGVLLATRALKPLDRPAWLLAMHRWLSALAVIATALHLGALVADSYVHFGVAELLVPGQSAWKTSAVAVGVVSMYLLVLVQATSLTMRKLPKRLWKGVHYTSYAMVWMVSVHAGMAGTDVGNRVYQGVALLLTIAAVTAAMVRILVGRRGGTDRAADTGRAGPTRPRPAVPTSATRATEPLRRPPLDPGFPPPQTAPVLTGPRRF